MAKLADGLNVSLSSKSRTLKCRDRGVAGKVLGQPEVGDDAR
ncbi:MAG: hypothetical protein ACRDLA_18950 [Thermoleophilaceae bacterium]